MDKKKSNWEDARLPPLNSDPSSSNSHPYRLPPINIVDPNFRPQSLLPTLSTDLKKIKFSDALQDISRPPNKDRIHSGGESQSASHTKSSPNTFTSPPRIEDSTSELSVLEKRRKNAEASSKSRIRRRIREIKHMERNRELEMILVDMRRSNQELQHQVVNLSNQNNSLRDQLYMLQESHEHNKTNVHNVNIEAKQMMGQQQIDSPYQGIDEKLRETEMRRHQAEERYTRLQYDFSQLNFHFSQLEAKLKDIERTRGGI